MTLARILEKNFDIDTRLDHIFSVTRQELIAIVREVVGARADAVDDDPAFTEGMFGHIHGVRNTSALFRSKGWERERKNNIDLVKHPDLPIKIAFQAVDVAAAVDREPKAVSGKGSGARRAIDDAQFSFMTLLVSAPEADLAMDRVPGGLWHFCVSVNGEDIRAELSLTSGVEDGNFKGFIERIFILREGEWDEMSNAVKNNAGGPIEEIDFEPKIRRKQ